MGREYIREIEVKSILKAGGDIIFQDDFEVKILKWEEFAGSDWRLRVATDQEARVGSACLFFNLSANPEVDDEHQARVITSRPETNVVKISLWFQRVSAIGNTPFLTLEVREIDNSRQTDFNVRYSPANERWEYESVVDTWTAIANSSQDLPEDVWFPVQLNFNISTKKFVKLVTSDLELDLSDISGLDIGAGSVNRIDFHLGITARSANQHQLLIDNVIIEKD